MDRRTFIKGATAAAGGAALLGTAGCAPAPIASEGYQLVWNDEFDTLGPIWQPEPWYASVFDWSRVSVANSVLTLTADLTPTPPYRDFTTLASIGPFIDTYPHRPFARAWQEGYFEVRARCTRSPWTKLALWFMSLETSNCWPEPRNCWILNAEWDMVENGIRAWDGPTGYADVNHVSCVHRNTGDGCGVLNERREPIVSVEGLSGLCDWHVWGGKWTADELTTYVDGQLLGSQAPFDTTAQPMYMLLSAGPTSDPLGNPPKPAYLQTQIDYVRVWQKAS